MIQSLERLNRSKLPITQVPLKNKVLQFGEGNFLRAFVDWMIYEMNSVADFNGGVTVVQPIEKGLTGMLKDQEGLYNVYLSGIEQGEYSSRRSLIDVIQAAIDPYTQFEDYLKQAENPDLKFIVSNTTEAGIQFKKTDRLEDKPASSFPGKLTQLLYRRFQRVPDSDDLIILPCELIDKNGQKLKEAIDQYIEHWNLEKDFRQWLTRKAIFCNTLVDRIVPGYPAESADKMWEVLGYRDELMVKGEVFHLWVIEGPEHIQQELPVRKANLNVVFTNNLEYYRTRKVRILNGAHTAMVPVAYLYGLNYVREAVENDETGAFITRLIFDEIIPSLSGNRKELEIYAGQVIDRFRNPSIKHELISIALNSFSKFKTRVLPSVIGYYEKEGKIPERLSTAFAALIYFYRGTRSDEEIPLNDEQNVVAFMKAEWDKYDGSTEALMQLVNAVLSNKVFWSDDLTELLPGLNECLTKKIATIEQEGIASLLQEGA